MPVRPRLRPLELFPVDADGEVLICLRDPAGLAERAFLRRPAALLAVLCDGTRTIAEVARDFSRKTGMGVTDAVVENLVAQLDEALLVEGPRVAARRQAVADEFRAAAIRPAAHAGPCYPVGGPELRAYLQAFEAKAGPRDGGLAADGVAGLIAPHIDFGRGGPAYARAYRALGEPPDLVIVLGTDHSIATEPFSLTRKPYATPLGDVPTDAALVDRLAREVGEWVFADELHHKHEHSIEFQAVWLRHVWGERTPAFLPVLCGSLHREIESGGSPEGDARRTGFLDALARAVAGRRVLVIAGADLAHVGPHFGDAGSMGGAESRARVEADDRAALAAAAAGDAGAFFAAVAGVRDRNRTCGLAPIWASLRLLGPRRGRLVDYAQCAADPTDDSFVSIASLTLR